MLSPQALYMAVSSSGRLHGHSLSYYWECRLQKCLVTLRLFAMSKSTPGWVRGSYWPHLQKAIADWSTYAWVQAASNSLCRLYILLHEGLLLYKNYFWQIFTFWGISSNFKEKKDFPTNLLIWHGFDAWPLPQQHRICGTHKIFDKSLNQRKLVSFDAHLCKIMSLTQPAPRPLKMFYPTCTQLLFRQGNPSIITSLPVTQQVQEYLITRGDFTGVSIIWKLHLLFLLM